MKPLDKTIITQHFGERPEYYSKWGLLGHEGVDLKTKGIGNSWGSWYDFKGWRNVYAVDDGICKVKYDKGGYGTHVILETFGDEENGEQFLYAHLKNAKVRDGQYVEEGKVIGISGNTGNTTGPHLHFAYRPAKPNFQNGYNGFENPAEFLKPTLNIALVGPENARSEEFIQKIREYTSNQFKFKVKHYDASFNVPVGTLTGDEAMKIIDRLGITENFVYIFYPANPTSAYEVASYYPAKNLAFCTVPVPCYDTIKVHAFLHLIKKYINFNHLGPHIEDKEFYPTMWSDAANFNNLGWKFRYQYDEIKTYTIYL